MLSRSKIGRKATYVVHADRTMQIGDSVLTIDQFVTELSGIRCMSARRFLPRACARVLSRR